MFKAKVTVLHRLVFVPIILVSLTLIGCQRGETNAEQKPVESKGDVPMTIVVTSSAFEQGQPIPRKYTGEGEDISPPLAWTGLPEGTKELALIVDDPDAPISEPFVHWLMYKIPPDTTELPEWIPNTEKLSTPPGAIQCKNMRGNYGYGGPMPPKGHGVHHYHFKLYALNTTLIVRPNLTKKALLAAMKNHVLAQGELIGTYQR